MSAIRNNLVHAIEDFLTETGISADRLGREAVGDHRFFQKLRRPGHGTMLTTLEQVESYMSAVRRRQASADA